MGVLRLGGRRKQLLSEGGLREELILTLGLSKCGPNIVPRLILFILFSSEYSLTSSRNRLHEGKR